jgi:queuine tRNA-ribosyltransferase
MTPITFTIEKKLEGALGRAGILETPHGKIETPAFVTVGTKATVKALTPEQVKDLGAQVVLANTYHLYLQPGDDIVRDSGGLHKFMNWNGPTMTDSGGFQAFSLGAAFGETVSKIAKSEQKNLGAQLPNRKKEKDLGVELPNKHPERLAKVTEDGVEFRSCIDGSTHFFTPEKSIEIQHNIGADMIFAFDECTSPHASYEYQKEALERTHRWAKRSLDAHKENKTASEKQGLFGIVQGGRFEDLRKESASFIGAMDFDGFGIGGSFDKEDMYSTVAWVNKLLPEEKPRHLLGIGEPADLFGGIENGCDLFDCVAPTRVARNGTLFTLSGKINIMNARFMRDFTPIDAECGCYTCAHYTRAYLAHLFRAKEMFASTLASIHNLYFIVNLVKNIRTSIVEDNFNAYKQAFLSRYTKESAKKLA